MLTPEAAWQRIVAEIELLASRQTPRAEAAGRVLAAAVTATVDQPQADVSAMDGYVVHGEVAAGAQVPVCGTVAAGRPPDLTLAAGEAAKIMTGAVVPPGGDRVIPVEQTDGGDQQVLFQASPAAGAHIRRGGEVIRAGEPLLEKGAVLTPGAISVLASHGYAAVPTIREPTVAVMTTGDEVIPPEEQPAPGQLRDSNTSFLLAAGRSLGLSFHSLGIAEDDLDVLREKIREGLTADVLLLCGGVSMGEYDFVEDVLAELGCEQLFDKVAIQPGKPLVAARHPGGWVFGLPGNPASVMVTFWLFVRPLLRRLQGFGGGFWEGALAAELTGPLPPSKGRDRFLPVEIGFVDGRILATPRAPQGSHDVVSYAHGTALVRVRREADMATAAGARCEVLPLGSWG